MAAAWVERAGRLAPSKDDGSFYNLSIAKVEAQVQSGQQAIDAMRGGGNYSGDMAYISSLDHDSRILASANDLATWTGICGQVVATVYDLASEIYHEFLFSELQAGLFADTQQRVDGSLAAASGTALEKIERVSDRLRDGDPESVSQALTTCRR